MYSSKIVSRSSLVVLLFFICGPFLQAGGDEEEGVPVRWDVPKDQYLIYHWEKAKPEVYDVFGYEATEEGHPVPDPGLVTEQRKVPEYLALFLPAKTLKPGDSFEYRRILTGQQNDRFVRFNRWVPPVVKVKGSAKQFETINGHRTLRIHQEIQARMPGEYLRKIKGTFESDRNLRHFLNGQSSVDIWFDPGEGVIRKFSYQAKLQFSSQQSKSPASTNEERTYILGTNRKIGGKHNSKAFRTRVKEAIEKGVGFLKEQESNGTWGKHNTPGTTALVTLTLLECGVSKEEEVVKKALTYLLNQPPNQTYHAALSLMAMDAYKEDPQMRNMEEKFLRGQISVDQYRSMRQKARKRRVRSLSRPEKRWLKRNRQFLLQTRMDNGGWGYKKQKIRWDNSNAQYGALGMHSAVRLGMKVSPAIWKNLLVHWIKTQAPDGPKINLRLNMYRGETGGSINAKARGWTYSEVASTISNPDDMYGTRSSTRGTMTVGGIGSMQLALLHLQRQNKLSKKLKRAGRQAIRDGWAWMAYNWSLRGDPVHSFRSLWNLYGLYGLERAGIFSGTRSVNSHNWYEEGAELLMTHQERTGGWGPFSRNACFALLFLKRASSPIITTK